MLLALPRRIDHRGVSEQHIPFTTSVRQGLTTTLHSPSLSPTLRFQRLDTWHAVFCLHRVMPQHQFSETISPQSAILLGAECKFSKICLFVTVQHWNWWNEACGGSRSLHNYKKQRSKAGWLTQVPLQRKPYDWPEHTLTHSRICNKTKYTEDIKRGVFCFSLCQKVIKVLLRKLLQHHNREESNWK